MEPSYLERPSYYLDHRRNSRQSMAVSLDTERVLASLHSPVSSEKRRGPASICTLYTSMLIPLAPYIPPLCLLAQEQQSLKPQQGCTNPHFTETIGRDEE